MLLNKYIWYFNVEKWKWKMDIVLKKKEEKNGNYA